MIIKFDGRYCQNATDIAAIQYRLNKLNYERLIFITNKGR